MRGSSHSRPSGALVLRGATQISIVRTLGFSAPENTRTSSSHPVADQHHISVRSEAEYAVASLPWPNGEDNPPTVRHCTAIVMWHLIDEAHVIWFFQLTLQFQGRLLSVRLDGDDIGKRLLSQLGKTTCMNRLYTAEELSYLQNYLECPKPR